ncbi:MAG: DUF7347 domain-containing protein [Candidatus Hodarchaeales archaeon]|jgi:DNA-binding transcriptional ArsR family regulator
MSSLQTEQIKVNINDVLKALNHILRREILIYMQDISRGVTFTELLETMEYDSKSSGQFSYHLKLLLETQLIQKIDDNNKYLLTPLGNRATSMINLVDDTSNKTTVQNVINAFKYLTPKEQIFVAWSVVPLVVFSLFAVFLESNPEFNIWEVILLFFMVLSIVLGVILLLYSRLQSIVAILTLSNFIWIVFLPDNNLRIRLGTIWFTSFAGLLFLGTGLIEQPNYNLLNVVFGLILLLTAIVVSIFHLYKEQFKHELI